MTAESRKNHELEAPYIKEERCKSGNAKKIKSPQ